MFSYSVENLCKQFLLKCLEEFTSVIIWACIVFCGKLCTSSLVEDATKALLNKAISRRPLMRCLHLLSWLLDRWPELNPAQPLLKSAGPDKGRKKIIHWSCYKQSYAPPGARGVFLELNFESAVSRELEYKTRKTRTYLLRGTLAGHRVYHLSKNPREWDKFTDKVWSLI